MKKSNRATIAAALYDIECALCAPAQVEPPNNAAAQNDLRNAEDALLVLETIADITGQPAAYILNRRRTLRRLTTDARAMYCACLSGYRWQWKDWEIAQLLQMEVSSIRHAIARHKRLLGIDEGYTNLFNLIHRYIANTFFYY